MNIYIENKKVSIIEKNINKIRKALYNNKVVDKNYSTKIKKKLVDIIDKIPLYNIYKDSYLFIEPNNLYNKFFNEMYRLKEHPLFDYQELTKKFINFLFYESKELYGDMTECIVPSFIPYFKHIKPYFSKQELLNFALNMQLIKKTEKIDYNKICSIVSKNTINSIDIIKHHTLIRNTNNQNLIKSFTFYDSYFYNNCLRNNKIFDELLYNNIIKLNNLINTSLSNDIIVYRFIEDDSYLKNFKKGDIYTTDSFISCTRNPFYNVSKYIFGLILLKINIPKEINGIVLSIEGYSMFPEEEEIILAPFIELKLLNIDTTYYHYEKNAKIIKRYEFLLQNKKKINIKKPLTFSCPIYIYNDLYKKMENIEDSIYYFYENICYNNYLFKLNIDNTIYNFTVIKYDSKNELYSKFYYVNTSNGILINYLDNNSIIYTFELTNECIYVNYCSKYYPLRQNFDEKKLIFIIGVLGRIFKIEDVIIFPTYYPLSKLNNSLENDIKSYNYDLYEYIKNKKKFYQEYDTIYNINYNEIDKITKFNENIDYNINYELNINTILQKLGQKLFINQSYYIKDSYLSYYN